MSSLQAASDAAGLGPRASWLRLAAATAASAVFLVLLCRLLDPQWETNDDAAMAMVAHGFGFAAQPSPQLVFSNVLWGHVVQALQGLGSLQGYGAATYLCLLLAGAVVSFMALDLRLGVAGVAGLLLMLFARAAVFPQFTLTAGLLAIAGTACLCWRPSRGRSPAHLVAAACLLFAAFLVRPHECLLVVAVLAPLLPWRALAGQRSARALGVGLVCAMALASWVDKTTYEAPEWRWFLESSPARIALTDFSRATSLQERPDLLEKYGLSPNDLELLRDWFFADRVLADPQLLASAVAEVGPSVDRAQDRRNAWAGITALQAARLQWLLLAAIACSVLMPSWRVLASWALCLAALAAIGFAGRPGVLRVYEPLFGGLLVAPLLRQLALGHRPPPLRFLFTGWPVALGWLAAAGCVAALGTTAPFSTVRAFAPLLLVPALLPLLTGQPDGWPWLRHTRSWLVAAVLAVCGCCQLEQILVDLRERAYLDALVRQELTSIPRETLVVWGDAFPFELVNPPLAPRQPETAWRLYGLGALTHAPFAVAAVDAAHGHDMVSLMNGPNGVLLLSQDREVGLLATYCLEHFDGRLETKQLGSVSSARVRRVWCRT